MNSVWLRPLPHPDRPDEVCLWDAATICGLRVQPLPWNEVRRGQPQRWVLHALISGRRAPIEVLRGEHEKARSTAATELARILATERGHLDRDGGGVIVTCKEETPEGVVFDVERTLRPVNSREWWPRKYRESVEQAERKSRQGPARPFPVFALDEVDLETPLPSASDLSGQA